MEQFASFGAWVRRRRKALDLTQVALAQRVGVAAVTIQKIEADERRPSVQVAALLAEQLQIAANDQAAFLATARGERAPDRLGDPSADMATGPGRLPARLSSFVGRAREQQELAALLAQPDVRLITLTGAGGIGKTSLAIQAARAQAGVYRDSAFFVDLAPVFDAAQVALVIAQSLGIPQVAGIAPREQLRSWLREKHLLLVLDNMEQVLDAAVLVFELLQAAVELDILVTSRAPLRVTGEHEYPVVPLGAESVVLFMERARTVRPGIMFDGQARSVAQAICEKLDGLPLAIELAAAQVRVFPLLQLLEQLHTATLPQLVGGARDVPPRQQTIRATIDWSYRLLMPAEQALFARLGVFVGGWTLEALEAIDSIPVSSVVTEMLPASKHATTNERLSALVDHGLVHVQERGGRARYLVLETVREYALERLRERGEEQSARRRHATYFTELAERAGPYLRSREQQAWVEVLDADYDNLRLTLSWCLQSPERERELSTQGLRTAAALWNFWLLSNRASEAFVWLDAPWSYDPLQPAALRARALTGLEIIAGWHDALRLALRYLHPDDVEQVRTCGDTWIIALALAELALTKTDFVRDDAVAYAAQALELARTTGDTWLVAYAELARGAARCFAEQERRAGVQQIRNAIALVQRTGDRWLEANGYWTIGLALLELGQAEEAWAAFARQMELYVGAGIQIGRELAAWGLAAASMAAGQLDRTRVYWADRVQSARVAGNLAGAVASLAEYADTAINQGDYAEASGLLQQQRAILEQIDPNHWQYASVVLSLLYGCFGHILLACHQGDIVRIEAERAMFEHYASILQFAPYPEHETGRISNIPYGRAILESLYALYTGDLTQAQASTEYLRSHSEQPFEYGMLTFGGLAASYQGDHHTAAIMLEHACTMQAPVYLITRYDRVMAEAQLGQALVAAGDIQRAIVHYRNVLPFLRSGRMLPWIANVMEQTAWVTARQDPEHAVRLWGAAAALRCRIGAPIWPVDQPEYERRVAQTRKHCDLHAWNAAWTAGYALEWEDAVEEMSMWLRQNQQS